MGWEMDSFLDCFSISFLTKEIVPKSNINGSLSENYKRCFHPNKTIFSRWSKLEWRLQVEEAWKIVAWLTCLSSFLQPDKKIKINSASVSKLNQNIIKNRELYSLQVQNKGFMAKNLGESLLGCPV